MSRARSTETLSGKSPLSHARRERFVQEYLVDLNATQAAIRAGYSAKSAGQTGFNLLKIPQIATRLSHLRQQVQVRTGITVERVLDELALVGFASVEDVRADAAGNLALQPGAPAGAVRAIASVKRTYRRERGSEGGAEVVTVEVRYWDKVAALSKIAQHLGMLVERHEHTGRDGGAIEVDVVDARRRLADRIARFAASN